MRIWDGGGGLIVDMGPYEYGSIPYVVGIEKPEPVTNALELTIYPNPFSGRTTLEFTLTDVSNVEVVIYNQLGQLVTTLVNEKLAAGIHHVEWQAGDLPEGVYLCRIQANREVFTHKIIKTK